VIKTYVKRAVVIKKLQWLAQGMDTTSQLFITWYG